VFRGVARVLQGVAKVLQGCHKGVAYLNGMLFKALSAPPNPTLTVKLGAGAGGGVGSCSWLCSSGSSSEISMASLAYDEQRIGGARARRHRRQRRLNKRRKRKRMGRNMKKQPSAPVLVLVWCVTGAR
jgi:hypothetical protein